MSKAVPLLGAIVALVMVLAMLDAGSAQPGSGETGATEEMIQHGRYLVHDVCMCVICHSPRDAGGGVIEPRLLSGGTIPLASPYPQMDWAFRAPKLRGLPAGWREEELIRFLQTREAPQGREVRPPMPPFHLNEQDARAVAAYLKSLD